MLKSILPPPKFKLPVLILSATFIGIILFIIYTSKAHSYLSDKPETCINCHIMAPQYATWQHSSHREHAHCNDCHVPHNNLFSHYYFKAMDGLRHATVFTLRNEPQVIFIKKAGAKAVHANCVRCHEDLLIDAKLNQTVVEHRVHRTDRKCWECHREVPHGRVNSLSSVPDARVPLLKNPIPKWIKLK